MVVRIAMKLFIQAFGNEFVTSLPTKHNAKLMGDISGLDERNIN
ncbi:hypothetical protein [Xenorhabdus santafensis]|nr:hypothetical protein [Xenorhabdus sp. 12]